MDRRQQFGGLLVLLVIAAAAQFASACVYLMGQALDSVAPAPAGNSSSWTYATKGGDWTGVDAANNPWICKTGRKQSPVNLHDLSSISKSPENLRTRWTYGPLTSNGSNVQVYNNGHTIQVQWHPNALPSTVQVQTAGNTITDVLSMTGKESKIHTVSAVPLQFHFHADSEHTMDGHFEALELHIVHSVPQTELRGCPPTGCLMVTGMMFKLADDDKDNAELKTIFDLMPRHEGVMVDVPMGKTINLQNLLPKDKTYAQYEGSLTTPPCTEGLLWHVFTEPLSISLKQLKQYSAAVGLKKCTKKNKRSMLEGAEAKHDHGVSFGEIIGFNRGSYAGFTRVSADEVSAGMGRSLLGTKMANPADYTCRVVAFGQTNRLPQPINDRTVRVF